MNLATMVQWFALTCNNEEFWIGLVTFCCSGFCPLHSINEDTSTAEGGQISSLEDLHASIKQGKTWPTQHHGLNNRILYWGLIQRTRRWKYSSPFTNFLSSCCSVTIIRSSMCSSIHAVTNFNTRLQLMRRNASSGEALKSRLHYLIGTGCFIFHDHKIIHSWVDFT